MFQITTTFAAVALSLLAITQVVAQDDTSESNASTVQITKPDSSGDVWYSIKLAVSNKTTGFVRKTVELQAVDKDGFEVTTVRLSAILGPSKNKTLTDKTFISYDDFLSIVEWKIKNTAQSQVATPSVIVSSIATRLQSGPDSSGDIWYAIKADVGNQGKTSIRGAELQAVDKNGYEITAVMLRGNVAPGKKLTLSEKTFMPHAEFKRISEWRFVAQ